MVVTSKYEDTLFPYFVSFPFRIYTKDSFLFWGGKSLLWNSLKQEIHGARKYFRKVYIKAHLVGEKNVSYVFYLPSALFFMHDIHRQCHKYPYIKSYFSCANPFFTWIIWKVGKVWMPTEVKGVRAIIFNTLHNIFIKRKLNYY